MLLVPEQLYLQCIRIASLCCIANEASSAVHFIKVTHWQDPSAPTKPYLPTLQ